MEDQLKDAGFAKKIFLTGLKEFRDCYVQVYSGNRIHSFGQPGHKLHAQFFVHDERFFARAIFGGDIGIGESYMDGDWSSPDLVAVVQAAVRNMQHMDKTNRFASWLGRMIDGMRHRRNDNTQAGSRKNIAYHYDLGNEFYKLFLDETMAYSCGYFASPADTLYDAQRNKFERICRKLDLDEGDTLLEIGTGWGGFALYAAQNYGCRVTTTTISQQQYNYARELFARSQEGGRIELLLEDYRNVQGRFDKIVSIEMFEAVGHKHYDEYFAACDRLLAPAGLMLLQTITMNEKHFRTYLQESDWIKRYIFPGAELASIASVLLSAGRVGTLKLAHMEDIGEHYAATLRCWRERFMSRLEDVRKLGFDKRFERMWEYYLAYSEGGFLEHYLGDAQLLLAKPRTSLSVLDRWDKPLGEAAHQSAHTDSRMVNGD